MRWFPIGLVMLVCGAAGGAEVPLAEALREDVVLRALVDEVERSIERLALGELPPPYFIEYALADLHAARASAALGAVTRRDVDRSRGLRTDVRVGSYELDNTNFRGGFGGAFGGGDAGMPIEDDYLALRQSLWWATDRDYKSVIEQLEQKKAFMESKLIEDRPPDLSIEEPVVYLEPRLEPALDVAPLEALAVALSRVFRDYPDILESEVSVSVAAGNKYLVNTEGSRLRVSGTRGALTVQARVQAEDGMPLTDSFSLQVRALDELPPEDVLIARCHELAAQLVAVQQAPVLDVPYTGPVLFEAEAATALFASRFAGQFAGGQRAVGSRTSPDDFANKLQRRVLPRFMSVIDDPSVEDYAGTPVLGHYRYDDQAVPAQRVALVEKGRLHNLLMSRNPSKEFARSNGHGRGWMFPQAAIGCLVVTADPAADEAELRAELLEAAADEGLAFGMCVRRLAGSGGMGQRLAGGGPLMMVKVFPDGREELVRGAEFGRFDLKAFKRMLLAGNTPYVMNAGGSGGGFTVIAPAMLFEELDLVKMDRDFDLPPILPNPVGRSALAP